MAEENINVLDPAMRVQVLQDIDSEDNRSRKREHQKRFDVYRERQDRYILERLMREFDSITVNRMRKIFSVNLSKRIVDEMSSIYNMSPDREFFRSGEADLSDAEFSQLEALYSDCRVNAAMRKANQFYNLHDQCALMVVPESGTLKVKAVPPFHYDVIPDARDPEKAFAYILNVWDFDLHKSVRDNQSEPTQLTRYRQNDRINQKIADESDRLAAQKRFIWWTDEWHFTTDERGKLTSEVVPNPIGALPFIDVADDKDFEFFVRRGTSVVDFALDFGLLLSDLANIIRLQGYSQAVVMSEQQPVDTKVGPDHVIWLKMDRGATVQPSFQFVSPSPDLSGSLEFLETTLRMFLSSRGIDPATISGRGEAKSFSSGVERLLAMLDKFEATRTDFDLFKRVEKQMFMLLKSWSNVFQNVNGEGSLMPELKQAIVSDDAMIDIKFNEPMAVQTQAEKEDSVIKLMDQGLMSRKEAIMKLRDVSDDAAETILSEIDEMEGMRMPPMMPQPQESEDAEDEENSEEQ